MVHVLLKPDLENFERYFASVWDECNCAVVWAFFCIVFLQDWNENWPFPVLWPLLVWSLVLWFLREKTRDQIANSHLSICPFIHSCRTYASCSCYVTGTVLLLGLPGERDGQGFYFYKSSEPSEREAWSSNKAAKKHSDFASVRRPGWKWMGGLGAILTHILTQEWWKEPTPHDLGEDGPTWRKQKVQRPEGEQKDGCRELEVERRWKRWARLAQRGQTGYCGCGHGPVDTTSAKSVW